MSAGAEKPRILTVDDDPDLAALISWHVRRWGYASYSAASAGELWEFLGRATPDVILMDLMLGDDDGSQLMARVKQMLPAVPVVMITGSKSVEAAVRSMRLGASDYITKPLDFDHLQDVISHELTALGAFEEREGFGGMVGRSEPMQRLYQRIENMAPTDVSALILGETGTGKELVARVIHETSSRAHGPWIAVNAAAIPKELIESQLFGHEKGAFTGADKPHAGYCEQADGGTLFLDEIGEMGIDVQAKLLRFLEDRRVQRLGSRQARSVDVRLLAATNVDVNRQIIERKLRPDLYYRLKVVLLKVPPLRERGQDLELLAGHFLEQSARRHRREFSRISAAALAAMERYPWPGNVRELKHAIEGAVVLHRGEELTLDMLPEDVVRGTAPAPGRSLAPAPSAEPELSSRQRVEKQSVAEALAAAGGVPEEAARKLGVSRATIYRKMKKYGLSGRRS